MKHPARSHRVHRQAQRPQFARPGLDEPDHGVLGGDIGPVQRLGDAPPDRSGVDDAAARAHQRQRLPGDDGHAGHAHVDDTAEQRHGLGRGVLCGRDALKPGIVLQDFEARHPSQRRGDGCRVGHVGDDTRRADPSRGLQHRRNLGEGRHLGACVDEAERDREPDAAARAGL
nr:hypothetical protein [Rubrimonas cliftonensis]